MPYCHKRYYIAKGKCSSVTKICSFMLMAIVSTQHVSSLALTAHHTKHLLRLPHRCCAHYIFLVALLLFVHQLCLFLHVVHASSFYSIAVLPTTLIFRTFARYSLFLFCLFYNTLHILASSSSQRAVLHSLQ